jgi:hypothetical protein
MNDDELESPGLSGWAGYALGRMAAERDRHTSETIDAMFNRRRQVVNVDAVLAQNQALANENARLRADLEAYRFNYANLKAWADRAEQRIEELKRGRG